MESRQLRRQSGDDPPGSPAGRVRDRRGRRVRMPPCDNGVRHVRVLGGLPRCAPEPDPDGDRWRVRVPPSGRRKCPTAGRVHRRRARGGAHGHEDRRRGTPCDRRPFVHSVSHGPPGRRLGDAHLGVSPRGGRAAAAGSRSDPASRQVSTSAAPVAGVRRRGARHGRSRPGRGSCERRRRKSSRSRGTTPRGLARPRLRSATGPHRHRQRGGCTPSGSATA